MQGFEVAGLYVLVAIAAFLVRGRILDLMAAPLAVRLAVVAAIGLGLSVPILMHGRNLVRDRFELPVLIVFVAAVVGLVVWLRR